MSAHMLLPKRLAQNLFCFVFFACMFDSLSLSPTLSVYCRRRLKCNMRRPFRELLQRQLTTRSLRSTDAPRLSVPWIRTETAKRTWCVAAQNVWNSLPNDIRNANSLSTFRAKLKTHFFLLHTRCNIINKVELSDNIVTYPLPRLCMY